MLPRGLLKEYFQLVIFLLRCFDVCAVLAAGLAAYFYKFGSFSPSNHYLSALILAAPLTAIVFQFFELYGSTRTKSFWSYISGLIQALFVAFMLLAGAAFITKTGETYSREWFGWWGLLAAFFLVSCRICLLLFLRIMRLYGWNERRILVIGVSEVGIKLIETVQQSLWTGFRVVTIFDDMPETKPQAIGGIPVSKTPDNIPDYLASTPHGIDEIWLAYPLREEARAKEVLYQLRHQAITIRFALDLLGLNFTHYSIAELAGFPILNICTTPMVGMNRLLKAIEDRLLASLILLTISPLFLLIAIAVKMSSPGPIFYRQKRVGWNGTEFEMLKFRTMPVDAESKTGPVWAKPGEMRATKVGAFLRRTSLDELPQFINVLRGDMSIVGPRPERLFFVEQFKEEIPRYMQKHLVKAGITGWAQVNGWRGNTSLEKRIEYDLFYIENWSLLFDLKIIFLTIFRGFMSKNAY